MARLDLVASAECFWFRAPVGEPLELILSQFHGKRREALERLLQQRYQLSPTLQQRIRKHERHRSKSGVVWQCLFGLLLPNGLLLQNQWDYDRDMDVLRREAAAVLSNFFLPSEYELQEHIDSETGFAEGKVLFTLYLS